MWIRTLFIACIVFIAGSEALAQIPGPGAERDMERIRELERGSVLRKDTIQLRDVVTVVDPETGSEVEQVIVSKYSVFDYCQQLLGMNNPDVLLKGSPVQITDPQTYEPMVIQWNGSASRIDTIK